MSVGTIDTNQRNYNNGLQRAGYNKHSTEYNYVSYRIPAQSNSFYITGFSIIKTTLNYQSPYKNGSGNNTLLFGISPYSVVNSNFNASNINYLGRVLISNTNDVEVPPENIYIENDTTIPITSILLNANTVYYLVFYPQDTNTGNWRLPGGNQSSITQDVSNQMRISYYIDDPTPPTPTGTNSYIYKNNSWHQATPYIYANGVWRQAAPSIYTNNSWH